jgi:predicted RecB family nuclease
MLITDVIFHAHLNCQTKSYLKFADTVGSQTEFNDWQQRLYENHKEKCRLLLKSACQEDNYFEGTLHPHQIENRNYHIVVDCIVESNEILSCIHALERLPSPAKRKQNAYIPIRFVPSEKITKRDKLMLAFDALALWMVSGKMPLFGKLIHGSELKIVKVRFGEMMNTARTLVHKIAAQHSGATLPPLILNKHCSECEYKERCRQVAIEKDELTLLSNINEKERDKLHNRGIFTVTQLSYTFRPRRRPKRFASKPDNYSHALKALAIREKKIHITGKPELSLSENPIYIDVEGDSDTRFYYLIGLRSKSGDSYTQYSFWANDISEEKHMWLSCLQELEKVKNPQLIHYGSYETVFLKRMKERYAEAVENQAFLDQLIARSINMLSIIYSYMYFPTYSNGLKEVAQYLGFKWSDKAASGLNAIMIRSKWECSQDSKLKKNLITYNAEDCQALEIVTQAVARLCLQGRAIGQSDGNIVHSDLLKREYPQRFGANDFKIKEFDYINQCAYWHYQRDKVYVRSSQQLKRISRKRSKRRFKSFPINTTVECPHDVCCPKCKAGAISGYGRMSKIVHDLKFSRTGIKRWVVKYSFGRYVCRQCHTTFVSQHRPLTKRFGWQLLSYAMYQVIELRISQRTVAKSLNQLFDFHMAGSEIKRQKTRAAQFYESTYEGIINKIVDGKLIHADETRIHIERKAAFVWVLTNLEEVAYFYTHTREGELIQELLSKFKGVLVSDFYVAYDSIDCPQQKCLIHIIRDLNDDLLKQPFNEEFKEIAQGFASLLKPVIDTVDRFGLKSRFLRKHKLLVDRFYKKLLKREYKSDVAVKWKKRFDKNRSKLFTFLDCDSVPWNNNNAEYAIKAFARLRRVIAGTSSDKGIREYLILLSICETCKYKGVNFLDFLRSGEKDIDKFMSRKGRN